MNKNFAVTGVGGYIAPRHLKAIRDTGNRLCAAVDPSDSVGVLDQFSYDVSFFTEFERFDRHVEKLRRGKAGEAIDYVTVCSPNYLHDAHVRFALRVGADAICEKPLVLNPWNCDDLQELEAEYKRRVYTVLQLRLHPALQKLKESLSGSRRYAEGSRQFNQSQAAPSLSTAYRLLPTVRRQKHRVSLTYVTSRGPWYLNSWKGNIERSGGLATNIGIHFFDMLLWLFGPLEQSEVHHASPTRIGGHLELEQASVEWFLSVDRSDLPDTVRSQGKPTFRSITVDGQELEFSENFTDLHTRVYEEILVGRGFGIDDARPSIELAHAIRHDREVGVPGDAHPFLKPYAKAEGRRQRAVGSTEQRGGEIPPTSSHVIGPVRFKIPGGRALPLLSSKPTGCEGLR